MPCMIYKLRCHTHFWFSANQMILSMLLIYIHILSDKLCRSKSVGSSDRNQLIWIFSACKGWTYPGSSGPGLKCLAIKLKIKYKINHIRVFFGCFTFCISFVCCTLYWYITLIFMIIYSRVIGWLSYMHCLKFLMCQCRIHCIGYMCHGYDLFFFLLTDGMSLGLSHQNIAARQLGFRKDYMQTLFP